MSPPSHESRQPRQPREHSGRYGFEGKWERPCLCGHALGVHTSQAPHSCISGDFTGQPCDCLRFRPRRLRLAAAKTAKTAKTESNLSVAVTDLPLDMDVYVPHGRGLLPSNTLRTIRGQRPVGRIGGYRVYSVDGAAVRNLVHIDFTTGGNPGRYSYVPEGEVWVERVLEPADAAASLLHELVETKLMEERGLDYDAAHEEASAVETYLRAAMVQARSGRGASLPAALDVARRWYEHWVGVKRASA